MKNFLSKHAFWVLQITGCVVFVLFIYLVAGMRGDGFARFIFAIGTFFSFFIPTTILRFLFKGFVNTNDFKLFDLLKIIVFIFLLVLFMEKLPYLLGYGLGWLAKIFEIHSKLESDFKSPKQTDFLKYVGLFIICSGWSILYFLIKQIRKQYAERLSRLDLKDKIKQAQLNTLKGHINPEFMVNSLSGIKALMLVDISSARKKLTKLSEILRYSLTKNNINTVLVEEELETTKNYVALLGMGTQAKHTIRFDIPSKTLKYNIPPMLLTSLVELATKHGVYKYPKEGEVLISSSLIDDDLKINVTISTKIARTKETDLLEKTIIQRLKLLFKEDSTYNVSHELNRTMISVVIPQDIMVNNLIVTEI